MVSHIFLIFTPIWGCLGKISTLTNIFQMGWFNHQPDTLNYHPILSCSFCRSIRSSKTPKTSVQTKPIRDFLYTKTHLCGVVETETKATNGGSRVEALGFQGFGTVLCLEVLPLDLLTPAEVRYLDPQKITKNPEP